MSAREAYWDPKEYESSLRPLFENNRKWVRCNLTIFHVLGEGRAQRPLSVTGVESSTVTYIFFIGTQYMWGAGPLGWGGGGQT
jgi:hypothetical protein